MQKKNNNQKMETQKKIRNSFMHHNMAVIGGFLGGYAILVRADFLGNAQTSNLIYLVLAVVGADVYQFLLRLGAVMLYIGATISYVFLKNKTAWNIQRISIGIDFLAMIALGFFPKDMNPILALYPVFFAMSFQWNAFPGEYGFASSTIFSTNNLRQVSLSFAEFLCDRDSAHLKKTKFFAGTLLCFHIGAVLSYYCVRYFSVQSVWLGIFLLIPAFALSVNGEKLCIHYEIMKPERKYQKINCKSA